MSSLPFPRNAKHRLFADQLLAGVPPTDAYLAAGYRCGRKSATESAMHLRRRPDVREYMDAVQQQRAHESLLTHTEVRRFFARIVRTPISKLDPEGENADLIKALATTGTGTRVTHRVEKLDPLKAIEMDLKLAGLDPEVDAMKQMAEAIAGLADGKAVPEEGLL